MKKIVIVIAPERFQEDEYFIPRKYFEDREIKVSTASTFTGIAEGYKGSRVTIDISINEIDINVTDAVVIVGGFGCKEFLWHNKGLHDKLAEADISKKIIAAVCLAPVCIAKAGLLDGKTATVYKNRTAFNEFENENVVYADLPVCVCGNIITADGPKSSLQFAAAVAEKI